MIALRKSWTERQITIESKTAVICLTTIRSKIRTRERQQRGALKQSLLSPGSKHSWKHKQDQMISASGSTWRMAAKHQTVHESTYVANFPLDKKVSAERTMQCFPAKRSEDVLHVVRFYVVIFYNKHFISIYRISANWQCI